MQSKYDFSTLRLRSLRLPRQVEQFDISINDSYTDDTSSITRESGSLNAVFTEANSRPMFVYHNTKSRVRYSVGDKKYYQDTILFWENVSKIMEGRTLKQKLSDASTDYILTLFSDDIYTKFFKKFYTSLNQLLTEYANEHKLSIPEDIAFFYKGGNLFRIILSDFAKHLEHDDFIELLRKRSDADFQIYINPSLAEYTKVHTEVVKRVLVALYNFKVWLSRTGILKIDYTKLLSMYRTVLKEAAPFAGFKLTNVSIPVVASTGKSNDHPFRSDFIMDTLRSDLVGYKEEYCLLSNYDKCRNTDPSLYISRNAASDFATWGGKRYYFELLRLKRNIKIKIDFETAAGESRTTYLQVPSEIIDVSIPKLGDSSLGVMTGNVSKYIQEYIYNGSGPKPFPFFGVSLEYLLYDLTDILYHKFEWPWLDAKYKKRINRYLLSLFLSRSKDADIPGMLNVVKHAIQTGRVSRSKSVSPSLQQFVDENITLRARVTPAQRDDYNLYIKYITDMLDTMISLTAKLPYMRSERFVKMLGGSPSRRVLQDVHCGAGHVSWIYLYWADFLTNASN